MYSEICTIEVFTSKLNEYKANKNFLFRGQTIDHPSFCTSFDRKGCVPIQKSKWEYYCYNALKTVLGADIYASLSYSDMLVFVDSMLQHYGWRSMRLDVTKSIDVSIFFACFQFVGEKIYQMVNDCYDNPVIEPVLTAEYKVSSEQYGYIYVFDINMIHNNKDLVLTDLTKGLINPQCRPVRQASCVISSFPKPIDNELKLCLFEVLKVKLEILLEYCKENEIAEMEMFPPASEDIIYNLLLNMPSKTIITEKGIQSEFYRRELDIPEYHYNLVKIQPPAKAYYSRFWIFENLSNFESDPQGVIVNNFVYYKCFTVDFFHFFSKEGNYLNMPEFIAFMRERKRVVLEFDNLFKYYISSPTTYQKGILFTLDDNLIGVYEIVMDWAGKEPQGFGQLLPRFYQIISDTEVCPARKSDDCQCNDDDRHLHKLLVGKYFAQMIKAGYLKVTREATNIFYVTA